MRGEPFGCETGGWSPRPMPRSWRLFHWLILRDLASNTVRTVLTVTGVALGVAVVVGVHLANDRAVDSFNDSLEILNGQSDLQISANGLDLDEGLIGELAWVWDVGVMTAIVEGRMDLDTQPQPTTPFASRDSLRLFGVDLLSDAPFRSYLLREGNAELGLDIGREAFLQLLVEPNAVVLPAALADRLNVLAGDTVPFLVGNRTEEFTVRAILEDTGIARAFDGQIVFMDIAAAQWALGRFGKIDRIEVLLNDPEMADVVAERIRAQLPASVIVNRPEDTRTATERMTRAFRYNLGALSYIALIVGMILIYNTLNIAVVRRRTEIGTLRTLGASRTTIKWMFLVEAGLFGIAGALLGIVLGELLARGAGALVSQTIALIYTGTRVSGGVNPPDWGFYGQMIAVGTVLAAVSGAGPALRATAISPVRILQSRSEQGLPRFLSAAGAATLALGVLLSFAPPVRGLPLLGYGAGLLFIAGFALLSPLLARTVLRAVRGWVIRALPAEGRLALQTVEGNLGRVVVAVMSLAIAVAMLSSVAIMVASFRETVVIWVDQTLQGDLYIRPAASGSDGGRNAFGNDDVELLSAVAGVAEIDRFRAIEIDYEGFPAVLGAGEFAVLGRNGRLLFMDGEDTADVAARLSGTASVVVSEIRTT